MAFNDRDFDAGDRTGVAGIERRVHRARAARLEVIAPSMNDPSPITHFEVYGRDPAALAGFHENLLGWSAAKAEGVDYWRISGGLRGSDTNPKPECVTIATRTTQWDIMSWMSADDIKGTHLEDNPKVQAAWAGMWVDAGPAFYLEHHTAFNKEGVRSHAT
jgi:hypothetical protein